MEKTKIKVIIFLASFMMILSTWNVISAKEVNVIEPGTVKYINENTSDETILDSGTCGENLTWAFDTNEILTISGTGDMYNYESFNAAPWYDFIKQSLSYNQAKAKKIVVEEGVTSIGSYAFSYCGCEVVLPRTLNTIQPYAFYNAFKYINVELELPQNVSVIGQYSFNNSGINAIILPQGLKMIGKYAFKGCVQLQRILLSDSLETIGDYAFSECISLSQISIPNNITSIPYGCFSNCKSLESIVLHNSIKEIYSNAFRNCKALKSILFPEELTRIWLNAFDGCTSLESVYFNKKINTLREYSFYNCPNLKKIFVPESVTFLGANCLGFMDDPVTGEGGQIVEGVQLYGIQGSKIDTSYYKIIPFHSVSISLEQEHYEYSGKSKEPVVAVKAGEVLLEKDKEYTVRYKNNLEIGNATAEVTFISEYAFINYTLTKNFRIGKSIENCDITLDRKQYQYHTESPKVEVFNNDEKLVLNKDYSLEIIINGESWTQHDEDALTNLWGVGTATIVIEGKGDYFGVKRYTFNIDKFDVSNSNLMTSWVYNPDGSMCSSTFELSNYVYDSKYKIQSGYRVCDNNDTINSKYYEVSYANNLNAGIASMIITGKGDYYQGKLIKTFNISPESVDKFTVKLSDSIYSYNGKIRKPVVSVTDRYGKVISSANYVVSYSNTSSINAGTYTVTVKFKGNYSGTIVASYKINPASITFLSLSTTNYVYDGKVKVPTVTVKAGSLLPATKINKNNSNVIITYAPGRINVGTYQVTIKGRGNYTGTKVITFKITPVKTSISSMKTGKKAITVNWTKKTIQVTGYQIQYSTSKTFASGNKVATILNYKTTTKTINSLAANKKYYVRIRTYKTVNKVNYYSGWSTVKNVKTKK